MKKPYGDLVDGADSDGFEFGKILADILNGDSEDTAFLDDASPDGRLEHVVKRKAVEKRWAIKRDLLRLRIASGALRRSVAPRSARDYALGLGSTSIAGRSSARINVKPQVSFRPERLMVPSWLAMDFLVTDLKIGRKSQLVPKGAIPAVMLTENAFGVRLRMDTAHPSMFITISVANLNRSARNFQGAIIGPAVE
jgi:hypothetical protein